MAKKWEYRVVNLMVEKVEEEALNSYGEEGWELVAVTHARVATPPLPGNAYDEWLVDTFAYFKREVG